MTFPAAHNTITHQYAKRRIAIEYKFQHADAPARNLIIWIHGLGDGLLTVPYTQQLAAALPSLSWALAEVQFCSSYGGWGTSSLASDAEDIAKCVKYFRMIKSGKIVLMGHSTGCQDIMAYLVGPGHDTRPAIDGAILQAPVSDREFLVTLMSPAEYQGSVNAAQAMISQGKGEEIMPSSETFGFFGSPVCARRWLSLMSPDHDGEDDYFSSDLSDSQLQRTFGALPPGTPLCILVGGKDECVPDTVDKQALLQRWIGFVKRHGKVDEVHSGIIKDASHNFQRDSKAVLADLVRRVLGFLDGLESLATL